MAEYERDFKGVWIPRCVWLDERLNALEKIILTEVDSLDMSDKGCFASNQYIAEFCQCSERKVSAAISKLTELGYIYVKSFDGRQRVLKSCLANFEKQSSKKCEAETQNLRDINTINNTNNNTTKKDIGAKRKRFTPPSLAEVEAYCRERKNNVDPQKFYDYFTASDWYDSKGKKVVSWKQKVITWEGYSNSKETEPKATNPTDDFMNQLKSMYQAN